MVSKTVALAQEDPTKDTGTFDPRVFKGGNSLRVVTDPIGMWYFSMERGLVPGPLKNKYASLNAAINQARSYFATKNIKIIDVI